MLCKLHAIKFFLKKTALGLHLIFTIISEDNHLTILTLPGNIMLYPFNQLGFL